VIDLSLPLQAAIVKALKEDAQLIGLIGGRVYDRVPDPPVAPYITVGDMQVVDDSNPCQSLAEYSGLVDCWSEAVGYPEVKRIGAAAVQPRCLRGYQGVGPGHCRGRADVVVGRADAPGGSPRHGSSVASRAACSLRGSLHRQGRRAR